jgi:NAD(P)-dependent dehydrogenase (short-subunit alcohol dehydrogenase family)
MWPDFRDRVVLVTGAGRGIGRAIALGFARAGASLVLNVGTHREEAESTLTEIEAGGGRGIVVQADVASKSQVESMVEGALRALGTIDVLVNNAGINQHGAAEEYDLELWNRIVAVNLTGVFLCSQAVAKAVMIPRRRGRIVNVSSISAEVTHRGIRQCAYHAAKGGVNMLTRSLAVEWVDYGIAVNALSPGFIATPLLKQQFANDPEGYEVAKRDTPMRRLGEPEELVEAALFLASESNSFMTGQNIVVDGGYVSW